MNEYKSNRANSGIELTKHEKKNVYQDACAKPRCRVRDSNCPIFISKKGKTENNARFVNRIRNSEKKRAKFKEIVPWEGCGEGELRSFSKNSRKTNQNMGCRGVYIYTYRAQTRFHKYGILLYF